MIIFLHLSASYTKMLTEFSVLLSYYELRYGSPLADTAGRANPDSGASSPYPTDMLLVPACLSPRAPALCVPFERVSSRRASLASAAMILHDLSDSRAT